MVQSSRNNYYLQTKILKCEKIYLLLFFILKISFIFAVARLPSEAMVKLASRARCATHTRKFLIMYAIYSIVLLLFLLGLGIPVAWSFAGMLALLTYLYDANLNTLMLQGFRSLNSVVLLALPLFIMAGYLMQSGGGWGWRWFWRRACLAPSPERHRQQWRRSAQS